MVHVGEGAQEGHALIKPRAGSASRGNGVGVGELVNVSNKQRKYLRALGGNSAGRRQGQRKSSGLEHLQHFIQLDTLPSGISG